MHFAFFRPRAVSPPMRSDSAVHQKRANSSPSRFSRKASLLYPAAGGLSPLPPKPQDQLGKVVRRKMRYFERRDYKDTRAADQGWLAGRVNTATPWPSRTSNSRERNPNCRRRLPAPIVTSNRDESATGVTSYARPRRGTISTGRLECMAWIVCNAGRMSSFRWRGRSE